MTHEELETLWSAPENWKWGIYYCKDDPRTIVPKRAKWMGWTINFARPNATLALVLILVSVASAIFASIFIYASMSFTIGAGVAFIALVCGVCGYFSSQTE